MLAADPGPSSLEALGSGVMAREVTDLVLGTAYGALDVSPRSIQTSKRPPAMDLNPVCEMGLRVPLGQAGPRGLKENAPSMHVLLGALPFLPGAATRALAKKAMAWQLLSALRPSTWGLHAGLPTAQRGPHCLYQSWSEEAAEAQRG